MWWQRIPPAPPVLLGSLHEGFFTQPRGFLLKPTCTSTSFRPQRQRNLAMILAIGSSHPARQ